MRKVNCSGGLWVSAIRRAPSGSDAHSRGGRERMRTSVFPLLWLPLGHGHGRVAHLWAVAVEADVDVLEPLLIVALGEVGPELGAPGLLALDRAHHGRLGAVEHVAELDRPEHVLVEDGAFVVDVGARRLLCEALDDLVRLLEALLVAVDGHVLVHRLAELLLDLRRPATRAWAS